MWTEIVGHLQDGRRPFRFVTQSSEPDRKGKLIALVVAMLGDQARAAEWINEPNADLGGRTPLAAARSDVGYSEVKALIGRIGHGVY